MWRGPRGIGGSGIFRIYFPIECLNRPSAFAVGYVDESNNWATVTGLLRPPEASTRNPDGQDRGPAPSPPLIGIWINRDDDVGGRGEEDVLRWTGDHPLYSSSLLSPSSPGADLLRLSKTGEVLAVCGHPDHCLCKGRAFEFVIILYDSALFLASSSLTQLMKSNNDDDYDDDDDAGDRQNNRRQDNVQIISGLLAQHQTYVDSCGPEIQKRFAFSAHRRRKPFLHRFADCMFAFPEYLLMNLILIPSSLLSNLRFFQIPAIKMMIDIPSTVNQMKIRYGSYQTDCLTARSGHRNPKQPNSRNVNACCLFGDVCLGLFTLGFLWMSGCIESYADRFIVWAEAVAVEFESLLHWLMGVPAGFKVNEPLAYFLGHFFLYHIFLWKAYLRTLRPFWSDICYYSCLSGCLGLTVQLSLLQDLISMMTIHIYCFYVYAARLYHLQVVALSSLWRLFCGKKLNVLRMRIDSASFDIDQLFAGTLFFTILLFTFPTTVLFYLVFAVLRLLVLSIQGMLSSSVSFMNKMPIYWFFLRLVRPSSTAGCLHASIVQHEPLCIYLQLKPISLRELFRMSTCNAPSAEVLGNTWTSLGKKLILGELIYPWIEPSPKPHSK